MSISRRELWWVAGGVLAVGALTWKRREVAFFVSDVVLEGRGRRLTHGTQDDAGNVLESPEELAAAAGAVMGREISADTYSIARVVRSEGALEGNPRAHVVLNDAAALGWTPTRLVTYSQDGSKLGRYGQQRGRRYATSADPYEADVVAAELAAGEYFAGVDPTGGATKFVDKGAFGVQQGTGSYAALVESWAADGLSPYNVPGYPGSFVIFRRA
jgi:hypothetical protein